MPVTYGTSVKNARMTATRNHFAGGTLELLSESSVVAAFDLSTDGGTVQADVWTITLYSSTVAAGRAGNIDGAAIKSADGQAYISGLAVGTDVIVDNTNVNAGQNITISTASIRHAA